MARNIAVIGAGSWGTALAIVLSGKHNVYLWSHTSEAAETLERERKNTRYLPGVILPENIVCTADLKKAVSMNPSFKEYARQDEDFKKLYDDEDFKKITL